MMPDLERERRAISTCSGFDSESHSEFHSEFHLGYLLDFAAGGAEVEKLLAGEAERCGEQRGRHLLNAGVVFLAGVVKEARGAGVLVRELRRSPRQLLKVGVGLEVR